MQHDPQKEEYTRTHEEQLAHWRKLRARLEQRATDTVGDAREEMRRATQELNRHETNAELRLTDLKEATNDAWDDMKTGFEKAWSDLEKSANLARSHFE